MIVKLHLPSKHIEPNQEWNDEWMLSTHIVRYAFRRYPSITVMR
ncbi:hypothetical protein [Shouchella lehensis]|nr:hypothetical protein [Shouchella lehensis]